jgi:hypothetical protein
MSPVVTQIVDCLAAADSLKGVGGLMSILGHSDEDRQCSDTDFKLDTGLRRYDQSGTPAG